VKNYYETNIRFFFEEAATNFLIANQDILNDENYKEYQETNLIRTVVFSDKLFDGKDYDLLLYMNNGSVSGHDIQLVFRSCSESYYLYRKSLFFNGITRPLLQNTNIESTLFLGDPTQLYSNVENGYGAWVACNEDWRTLYYQP
jgi:hypothetical protein